jgi:hypothetical protein
VTTAQNLIDATRAHLLAWSNDEANLLDDALNNSATSFDLAYALGGAQAGALLAVDLELMRVWAADNATKTVTVQRGYLGTTKATHADDSIVEVAPRFPAFSIFSAINDELRAYSSPSVGLYRTASVEVTYNPARSGYDLLAPGMIGDPLAVEGVGILPGDRDSIRRWRIIRDADTGDFASGVALYLYEGIMPGKDIRVTYRKGFDPLAALADDVLSVAGLPTSAHDIPPLGAAARLLAGREARRVEVDSQPQPRAGSEVPPGANTSVSRQFFALRQQRLVEEAGRLAAQWPTLTKV